MRELLIGIAGNLIVVILVAVIAWVRGRVDLGLARAHPRISATFFLVFAIVLIASNVGSVLVQPWAGYGSLGSASIIVASCSISLYILWRELQQFWRVGLQGADREIARGVNYRAALLLCKNYLDFLGVGASKLTREDEFSAALLRCRPDAPIRLLLGLARFQWTVLVRRP
jgi:hypothetical protein